MTTKTLAYSSSSDAGETAARGFSLLGRVWAVIAAFLEETHAANVRTNKEQPFGL